MSVRDPYSGRQAGRPTNFVWLPKERAPESSSPCVTKTTTTLLSSTFRFNSLSGRVLFCGLGGAEWNSAAAIHNSSSCCYEAVSRTEAQIQLLRHCPPPPQLWSFYAGNCLRASATKTLCVFYDRIKFGDCANDLPVVFFSSSPPTNHLTNHLSHPTSPKTLSLSKLILL